MAISVVMPALEMAQENGSCWRGARRKARASARASHCWKLRRTKRWWRSKRRVMGFWRESRRMWAR